MFTKGQKCLVCILLLIILVSTFVTISVISQDVHVVSAAKNSTVDVGSICSLGLDYITIKEMEQVPEVILQSFATNNWHVGPFARFNSPQNKFTKITSGKTVYSERTILIQDHFAVIHEFGHYVDYVLGFPNIHLELYEQESESASAILGQYSTTNRLEYFAEVFAYWIKHQDDCDAINALCEVAPKTCLYFEQLSESDWGMKKDKIVYIVPEI